MPLTITILNFKTYELAFFLSFRRLDYCQFFLKHYRECGFYISGSGDSKILHFTYHPVSEFEDNTDSSIVQTEECTVDLENGVLLQYYFTF